MALPYVTTQQAAKIAKEISAQGGSGGSTVVANPTLAGTEEELTGLEVDGTKYKVTSGGSGDVPIASDSVAGIMKTGGVYAEGNFLPVLLDENDAAYVDTDGINTININASQFATIDTATINIATIDSATIGSNGASVQIGTTTRDVSSDILIGMNSFEEDTDYQTTTVFKGNVDFTNADVTGISGVVPVPAEEDLVFTSGHSGTYGWTQPAKPIFLDDLSLGVDPSTFDITGVYVRMDGELIRVTFSHYLDASAQSPSATHYDVQLFAQMPYGDDTLTAGSVYRVENVNAIESNTEVTGDIIFKCSSLDQSGLITLVNTIVPDKFPADTTDLLIKWSREFDETSQNYEEAFEWIPVCNQSKVIVPLSLSSLTALNNIITAFMTEAVPNKLGQFVYAEINDTFTELSDILAYLNAGKEVWIDLGSNFDNSKALIKGYATNKILFNMDAPNYSITGVGNVYVSAAVVVGSSTISAQGFIQVHST